MSNVCSAHQCFSIGEWSEDRQQQHTQVQAVARKRSCFCRCEYIAGLGCGVRSENSYVVTFLGGYVWGQCLQSIQTLPDPSNWGWKKSGEEWQPVWTTIPVIQEALMTLRWLRAGLALAKTCPREQSLPHSARREQSLLRTHPCEESLNSDSCPSLATLQGKVSLSQETADIWKRVHSEEGVDLFRPHRQLIGG